MSFQRKQGKASETVLTSTSGSAADQTEIEKLEEQATILREVEYSIHLSRDIHIICLGIWD